MTMGVLVDHASAMPTSRSTAATRGDAQERQLAWKREMERAQLSNWFKSDSAPRDGAATPQLARSTRGIASHCSGPQERPRLIPAGPAFVTAEVATRSPPVVSAHRVDGAPSVRASVQTVPAKAAPSSGEADIPTMRWAPAVVVTAEGISSAKASPILAANCIDAAESRTSAGEPPPVLRLHAEPRPEGQAVWIAMRADDDALRTLLPGIVADLQRALRERGERLHLVVCNGRPVWRDGAALRHDNNVSDSFQDREI